MDRRQGQARAQFACVSFGLSHARNAPAEMKIPGAKRNEELLRKFAASKHVQALVKNVVVTLEVWFPRLARLYSLAQRMFYATQGLMNSYFPGCPFAAQSINIADQTVTDSHVTRMLTL
ncbi:hypothetical protein EUX98_g7325 [Antrodiella citrinella]|uniref:Uncharacterized protein n=1 Tax=Antrodiella citrinella TaxID=2447956 RepID=A0A4S4MLR7_9APHY|nr:hypothetical protein EUX98_g7325 [Antrodiella citrinella]